MVSTIDGGWNIPSTEIRCGKGTDTWSNMDCLTHSMGLRPIRQKITATPQHDTVSIQGNIMIQFFHNIKEVYGVFSIYWLRLYIYFFCLPLAPRSHIVTIVAF